MTFITYKAARDYAVSITADMRGIHKHKAVKANAWRFDRTTGKYSLAPCWTVVLA
jgi:hypothetical protein